MKILVTGAAGFIGSHLAEKLSDLGHEVVGLDCFTPYYSRELKILNTQNFKAKSIKLYELDLTSGNLLEAVNGVEVIYHLAGQPGITKSVALDEYVKNNIWATQGLINSVKESQTLKMIVNISTSSVYGQFAQGDEETAPKPTSYYGVTKLAAEQLLLAYQRDRGLPACSMRLFSVYGERERPEKVYPKLIKSILDVAEFPLREGSENHQRSYTYVGDIIDGLVLVLDHLPECVGEIFNLGTDQVTTTGENIKVVEEVLGKKAKIKVVERQPGDQERTSANIAKAQRILGYSPKTTAREGLEKEALWYKETIWNKVTDLSYTT